MNFFKLSDPIFLWFSKQVTTLWGGERNNGPHEMIVHHLATSFHHVCYGALGVNKLVPKILFRSSSHGTDHTSIHSNNVNRGTKSEYQSTYSTESPARSALALILDWGNSSFSSPINGIRDSHIVWFNESNSVILIFGVE